MSFDIIDPERDSKVLGLYQSRASPICDGQAAFRVPAWAQLPLLYERRPNAFYAPGLIARGKMPRMRAGAGASGCTCPCSRSRPPARSNSSLQMYGAGESPSSLLPLAAIAIGGGMLISAIYLTYKH